MATFEGAQYLKVESIATQPIEGQKPGTSGLRKKTKVFMQGLYLHNFVQSIFDVLPATEVRGCTLVLGGDGRYWSPEAIQIITKIAVANGVARLWIGQNGLLSTPAASAVVRERENGAAYGAIILTASHNPGGIDEDFGIKYNVSNGGPAPESVTDAMYAATRRITNVRMCSGFPDIDITKTGKTTVTAGGAGAVDGVAETVTVEVIDSVADYAELLERVFDMDAIKRFLSTAKGGDGGAFKIAYDALSGVGGIYAQRVLADRLGLPVSCLSHCTPLPDFGGLHPDPNLTYASGLVETMGLLPDGTINPAKQHDTSVPDFGAAQDGDADRNMILGRRFFVTPSDSVAIIAAQADAIPFFATTPNGGGGLKGVARSMPTSAALDRVAAKRGLALFEVPTGWKFFGNLMDSAQLDGPDYCPFLCGEESFGTGSNHVREKDGLWAVLAWLSILAHVNKGKEEGAPSTTVEDVVRAHWREFGRNYYCRYDYEGVDSAGAEAMMGHLRQRIQTFNGSKQAAGEPLIAGGFRLAVADEFRYVDPVDHSVSDRQGLRFIMSDGSRIVFRLSGTGSVGATVRVYLEKYEPDASKHDLHTAHVMADLVAIALDISQIQQFTGRTAPTVIT